MRASASSSANRRQGEAQVFARCQAVVQQRIVGDDARQPADSRAALAARRRYQRFRPRPASSTPPES